MTAHTIWGFEIGNTGIRFYKLIKFKISLYLLFKKNSFRIYVHLSKCSFVRRRATFSMKFEPYFSVDPEYSVTRDQDRMLSFAS